MLSCLRSANATDLVSGEWDAVVLGIMGCPFTPVLDGKFFPESPAKALEKKNFKKTNILIGTNQNEGFFFIIYYLADIFRLEVRTRVFYS